MMVMLGWGKWFIVTLGIFIMGGCGSQLYAGASLQESVLQELDRKAESIESYICEVEVEKGGIVTSRGKVWFKSSPRSRKEESVTGGIKWITFKTGDRETTYVPDLKLVFIDKSNWMRNTKVAKDLREQFFPDVPSIMRATVGHFPEGGPSEKYFIYIAADKSVESFDALDRPNGIEMIYNKEHGYIEQLKLLDSKGQPLQIQRMRNYQLNVEIPDEEFIFTPPSDCQVVDKTQGVFTLGITKEMGEIIRKRQAEFGDQWRAGSEYKQDSAGNWYRLPNQSAPEQSTQNSK